MNQPKLAVVTGAGKGMGLEWVKQLTQQGYDVILTARTLAKAEAALASLPGREAQLTPFALEVTRQEDHRRLLAAIREHPGQLDLLVNNAGINSRTRGAIAEELFLKNVSIDHLDPAELLHMVEVNATAPILLAHHLRPVLRKAARPVVLNISSWMSSISLKKDGGNYSYAVSKAALNMMNRAFAHDVKAEGITAVVINPGWVQTDMGGQKATLTPEQSIQAMIEQVLEKITLADTGGFFNYDGQPHPW